MTSTIPPTPDASIRQQNPAIELVIEHLQMSEVTTNHLRSRGIETIADLFGSLGADGRTQPEDDEAVEALSVFLSVCSGHRIDWYRYWEKRNFELSHLFLDCAELASVGPRQPVCRLDRSWCGNAGPMLERSGIISLGDLVEAMRQGIRDLPAGMGATKKADLLERIVSLVAAIRSGEAVLENLSVRFPLIPFGESDQVVGSNAEAADDCRNPTDSLSSEVRAMGIGVLHLGAKTALFENAGLLTVGALVDTPEVELLKLPGLGRKTLQTLEQSIQALVSAQQTDGSVDWEAYCAELGLHILPKELPPPDSRSVIAALPALLTELSETAFDDDESLIFRHRIAQPPKKRKTLEALGDLFPESITRERVRQKEAKLLSSLASALIFDDYARSRYHFRPEVTEPWKIAALYFSDTEQDLSLAEFISGLEDAWGVSRSAFVDVLPLIATIITGELPSGGDFGNTVLFDSSLLQAGSGDAWQLPVRSLQIWKAADQLEESGLRTVGLVIDALNTGVVAASSSNALKTVLEHIKTLAGSVSESGKIDWCAYADRYGFEVVPAVSVGSPEEFLTSVNDTAVSVLDHRNLSVHASEIWKRRCILGVAARPSMEAVSEILGGYGSSLKRIETALLGFLNDVFVHRNLAIARCQIRPEFLDYWTDVDAEFQNVDGDIKAFTQNLSFRWGISPTAIEALLPSLVAVLTGYPYGRLGRYTRARPLNVEKARAPHSAPAAQQSELPQRISLRGFRRQH